MDSPMKQSNRLRMLMNAAEQMLNSMWKQYSNVYSKFLIRFSWSILSLSFVITVGLTLCCFLLMKVRPFDQNDFKIPNGLAAQNALRIRQIFGNDSEFRMHQQLNLYPGLDIIIKRKVHNNEKNDNLTNMLNEQVVNEVAYLTKQVETLRIRDRTDSKEYNYSSLCTKMNSVCIVDGNYILTERFRREMSHLLPPKHGYYMDESGGNGIPGFMFGKNYKTTNSSSGTPEYVDYDEENDDHQPENDEETTTKSVHLSLHKIISYVPLFRLRFSLNSSTLEMRQLANDWEHKVLHYLNEDFNSTIIDIFPSTSTALSDAITEKAHEEGFYMMIMFVIFFFLLCFCLSIQGNFHTSVGYLPLCGIISICLSTGATFGLISIFRFKMIEPMTLLIFIVALIDSMRFSIVCGEYHRIVKDFMDALSDTPYEIDVTKLLSSIIESTHPYFIISTLTISCVYGLLAMFSPMSSTMPICLTLALYIFINYIVHSTFFSSCLVITLKRIASHRHSLTCCQLSKDYYTKSHRKSSCFEFLRSKIYAKLNIDSGWKRIFSSMLCLLSIVFVILSLWFGLSMDTCLFDDQFLPRDVYSLRSHMQSQVDDFEMGPVIMFTIPIAIDYDDEQNQAAMRNLLEQCRDKTRTSNFTLLWLMNENITVITTGKELLQFRITPFSPNDLIVSDGENYSTIEASRFYCQYKSIRGDREDIRTMNNMYSYAQQSAIPSIFPYSILFPNYESLGQLRIEICALILALIICCFISTLVAFFFLKTSLIIIFHFLALSTGALTCLYLFHNFTYNFVAAPWLYIVPILFLDTLIHLSYNRTNGKWKYNRVILSIILSVLILYSLPIQTYIFKIIIRSILYQSIIVLILVNLILPSWFYLFQSNDNNDNNDSSSDDKIDAVISPTITVILSNNSLQNDIEPSSSMDDFDNKISDSI